MTKDVPFQTNYSVGKNTPVDIQNFRNPWIAENGLSSSSSSRGIVKVHPRNGNVYRTLSTNSSSKLKGSGCSYNRSINNDEVPTSYLNAQNSIPRKPQYRTAQRQSSYFPQPSGSDNPIPQALIQREHLNQSVAYQPSDRSPSPVSIDSSEAGVVDPCGGHCRTFERFCRYFLQVLFVIGILAGVTLVLAGYILHSQRRGSADLLVLVYIGALMAMVCTLLLSIHCSSERQMRRRKRRRMAVMSMRSRISLNAPPFRNVAAAENSPTRTNAQYLSCCHQDVNARLTAPSYESPLIENSSIYCETYEELDGSQNGRPWWRQNENQVTMRYDNIV